MFLVVTAVALATAVTTKDQTAALKPDSDEFRPLLGQQHCDHGRPSSAATHFALSLHFFLEGRQGHPSPWEMWVGVFELGWACRCEVGWESQGERWVSHTMSWLSVTAQRMRGSEARRDAGRADNRCPDPDYDWREDLGSTVLYFLSNRATEQSQNELFSNEIQTLNYIADLLVFGHRRALS